ncbi:hypothetical protein MCEMSE15_01199 [Fimbriimonadaceae bacterium]
MTSDNGKNQDRFIRRTIIVVLTVGGLVGAIGGYSDILSGRVSVTPLKTQTFIISWSAALGVAFAIPVSALVIIVYVFTNAYRNRK